MQIKNRKSESDTSARSGAGPSPEGEPTRHGRRGFLGWKLLVVAGMLAAGLALAPGGFVTGTAVGQDPPTRPSVPTTPTATVGDTEVLLSWSSGGAGQNGNCPTTEYYVEVFELTSESGTSLGGDKTYSGPLLFDTDSSSETSVHFDMGTSTEPGLKASTKYFAEVHAYGKECDNYSYSDTKAIAAFTTNASNSGSDPTAPAKNSKKTPARVKNLTATPSGTSVTLTWTSPNAGRPAKRCSIRNSSNTVEYAYEVYVASTDTLIAASEGYTKSNATGNSQISVTLSTLNLTSGTGYYTAVSAYSPECDEWGRYRYKTWTQ